MSGEAALGLIPNLCCGFSPSPQAIPWISHVQGADPASLCGSWHWGAALTRFYCWCANKIWVLRESPSIPVPQVVLVIDSFYFKILFFLGIFFFLLGHTSAPHTTNPGVYLDFGWRFGQVFYRLYQDCCAVILAGLRILWIRSRKEIWSRRSLGQPQKWQFTGQKALFGVQMGVGCAGWWWPGVLGAELLSPALGWWHPAVVPMLKGIPVFCWGLCHGLSVSIPGSEVGFPGKSPGLCCSGVPGKKFKGQSLILLCSELVLLWSGVIKGAGHPVFLKRDGMDVWGASCSPSPQWTPEWSYLKFIIYVYY